MFQIIVVSVSYNVVVVMQMPQALVQTNESDSIPQKVANNYSGE